MEWFIKCVTTDYWNFSGRARRKEYWMFYAFNCIAAIVVGFIVGLFGLSEWLTYVYSCSIFVPSIAVGVRRLHDVGKSGWWMFISLIPLVGTIWLLVLLCTDSQLGTNKYGENPKGL